MSSSGDSIESSFWPYCPKINDFNDYYQFRHSVWVKSKHFRKNLFFYNFFFLLSLISYYGLWLWFPELFNRLQIYYEDHNVTVSVCEVVDFKPNTTGQDPFEHCQDASPPDNQVFINAFIVAIAPLPANVWTIFHMDKLGRKFFLGKL
jgi:VNT family MFS transporter (synaptic vesicle glycoprotein 2)